MLPKSVALVVPPLAAPAAWDARLRIWAALRTQEARLGRSAPRGGMQRCRSTPRSETDYSFYDGHLEPKLRLSRRARRSEKRRNGELGADVPRRSRQRTAGTSSSSSASEPRE